MFISSVFSLNRELASLVELAHFFFNACSQKAASSTQRMRPCSVIPTFWVMLE